MAYVMGSHVNYSVKGIDVTIPFRGFPLVLLVLLLGMGIGGSGEDASYLVSELGSDTKALSSGLSLAVIVEGLLLLIEGNEGVIGVLSSR